MALCMRFGVIATFAGPIVPVISPAMVIDPIPALTMSSVSVNPPVDLHRLIFRFLRTQTGNAARVPTGKPLISMYLFEMAAVSAATRVEIGTRTVPVVGQSWPTNHCAIRLKSPVQHPNSMHQFCIASRRDSG